MICLGSYDGPYPARVLHHAIPPISLNTPRPHFEPSPLSDVSKARPQVLHRCMMPRRRPRFPRADTVRWRLRICRLFDIAVVKRTLESRVYKPQVGHLLRCFHENLLLEIRLGTSGHEPLNAMRWLKHRGAQILANLYAPALAANPQTRNMDFRGFGSRRFLSERGGLPLHESDSPLNLDSGFLVLWGGCVISVEKGSGLLWERFYRKDSRMPTRPDTPHIGNMSVHVKSSEGS